jgi:hypothetical protein
MSSEPDHRTRGTDKAELPVWLERLRGWVELSDSPEDWGAVITLGPCPKCREGFTQNCEEAPGIQNVTLAVCAKCSHLWCLECQAELSIESPVCNRGDGAQRTIGRREHADAMDG